MPKHMLLVKCLILNVYSLLMTCIFNLIGGFFINLDVITINIDDCSTDCIAARELALSRLIRPIRKEWLHNDSAKDVVNRHNVTKSVNLMPYLSPI